MEDFVPCKRIAVYLLERDEDGKQLGFNFIVRMREATELERFVKETLEIFDIPNDGVDIFSHADFPSIMMRDKNDILKEIKNYKERLDKEEKKSNK